VDSDSNRRSKNARSSFGWGRCVHFLVEQQTLPLSVGSRVVGQAQSKHDRETLTETINSYRNRTPEGAAESERLRDKGQRYEHKEATTMANDYKLPPASKALRIRLERRADRFLAQFDSNKSHRARDPQADVKHPVWIGDHKLGTFGPAGRAVSLLTAEVLSRPPKKRRNR
jgi:hypothetical protein